ncbi:glycosyl hydrolase family 28-related protein [Verrucosispora sp. TAA-831]|uniref:glycosyl hydrolase family 28-related protein n=1 Tax=Verrucosispora sp. TAA-831 TaxID=3422227 RepID=UPI003D6E9019
MSDTRLLGPDEAYRTVYLPDGRAKARGYPCPIFADVQGSIPADIQTPSGDDIAESTLIVDVHSRIPLFLFPAGADTVYTSVNGGPIVPLYARVDSRLDDLDTRLQAVETNVGEGMQEAIDQLEEAVAGKQAALPTGGAQEFLRGSDKTFVAITSGDVGLGSVDDTSDADKPLSTAAVAALAAKAPLSSPSFTGTVSGVTKAMVGLGSVDNTSDLAKPLSTAATIALAGKVNAGDLTVNVKDFGALGNNTGDDGPAIQAAINSLPTSGNNIGGCVYFPIGTYRIATPITLRSAIRLVGAGRRSSRLNVPTAGNGLFVWTANLSHLVIQHLYLSGSKGHLFTPSGGDYGFHTSVIEDCVIVQQDPASSILRHVSTSDYDNVTWRQCDMTRIAGSTVPGFHVVNDGGAANQNRWEDCWAHSQNSNAAPFFWLESTSGVNYAYDNVFRNITGEQNAGGLIRALSTYNLVVDNVTDYDTTVPYTASVIHVGRSSAVGGLPSVYPLIRSSGRRDNSSLPTGMFDVNLPSGEVQRALIQSPNHSSSTLKVNFGTGNVVTVHNAYPGSWPTAPDGAMHYYSHPPHMARGLFVGSSRISSGTGSPEGVVTGAVGDQYIRSDGGRGLCLYVKETGPGNTGWAPYGWASPRASVVGGRRLLSGWPSPMVVGTVTLAKDTWRYMPLSLTRPLTLTHLGVLASTAATGGTAAMIFGLFAVDAAGKPASRVADYSTYGSIDLSIGAGAEAMLATSGLTIPAGDWMIGCAWTGTASASPVLYSTSGAHPAVAGTSISQQANAYQQAATGAAVPDPATPAGGATSGIAIYGATA